MNNKHISGLTLVELLVSIGLASLILTFMVNFLSQSGKASVNSNMRSEIQKDALIAQQLISGKLNEAWYVYPVGQKITMSSTNNPLTKSPVGNNTWTVGTDPILAMILPPNDNSKTCPSTPTATSNNDGCYRFFAYFPILRSDWLTGTAADTIRNPGKDPANNSQWVLAEYRGIMPGSFVPSSSYPPSTAPLVPADNTPNLLADYVSPANTPGNTYTMFTFNSKNSSPTSLTNPVQSVVFNLAVSRNFGTSSLRLPDSTNEYGITISLPNIGKIAAS